MVKPTALTLHLLICAIAMVLEYEGTSKDLFSQIAGSYVN